MKMILPLAVETLLKEWPEQGYPSSTKIEIVGNFLHGWVG